MCPARCRICNTNGLSFAQKGQKKLSDSLVGMRYFVHGWFRRFHGDDGLQYAMWCTQRTMCRCPARPTLSARSRPPYLTRVKPCRRGCSTEEIDEAVENYQDEATRLPWGGEGGARGGQEEAIQEAQEAERQRQEAEGQAELAPVPIAGAPELQQPMAA